MTVSEIPTPESRIVSIKEGSMNLVAFARRRWVAVALALAGLAGLAASEARGVPAFARRYRTSCATCHQAYPRLNAVGESFRLMGFRFVDDERYRKSEPVEMGDEAYKRLWPKALWPTDIPSTAPLSFISRFMVEADLDGSRPDAMTFLLPEEVELVWAGNLGDDLLFYGDVIFLQKDFGGMEPDSWATVKAWLQFQSLIGPENRFNLRVGSVGTQTMGLFTARDANFYGTHYYQYTSWLVPEPGLSAAGLEEFKGNNFSIGPQAGIEVNGAGERWFYALGLVSGDLAVANGLPPESDVSFMGMGKGSGGRDGYLHLAYKIGGLPFDRSRQEAAPSLAAEAEFWRDDALILALFGYTGRAEIRGVPREGEPWVEQDDFWRAALGAQLQRGDWSLAAAYSWGQDDNPYGPLARGRFEARAWHAEALWFAYPWLIPYARYEVLERDLPAGVPGIFLDQDISRWLVGAKLMVRPNVSCVVEAASYSEGAELEEGFDGTLFVLLAASF